MKFIKYILVLLVIPAVWIAGCESNDNVTDAVCIPAYDPVNKKILVEFFTNAGCNPCIAAHNYLDEIAEHVGCHTLNDSSVVVISYHTRYPYSFDSLYRANVTQNEFRSTTYYGVLFTPQARIDGVNSGQFSSSSWSAQIDAEFKTTKYLDITLSNFYDSDSDSGTVSANVSLVSALPSSDNVIHIVITENNVSYVTSPNGITNPDDVMRTMVTGQDGESISVGQNTSVSKNYRISPNWDENECYINVFIQSTSTKQVFGVEKIKVVK